MKTKILIIEDDSSIRLGLVELLRSEGFDIAVCERGDKAVEHARKFQPALIVLDVMLPGRNGFDICRDLRAEKSQALILMLTAKSQELDKVVGLDLGADDYVTKPFGVRELLARIHALLRRCHAVDSGTDAFTLGKAEVDPKTYSLRRGREVFPITETELKLLQIFHQHRGQVLSRERLLNNVWGVDYFGTTRTLDQFVAQLRKKLGDTGSEPRIILTVHGVGYRLEN